VLWPNLPVLLLGSFLVAGAWSVVRAASPQLGWASLVGLGLVVVPVFATLLRGCEVLRLDEHYGVADLVRGVATTFWPAVKVAALPAFAVLLTTAALDLWRLSGQTWMLVSVAVGSLVSALALYTGVVALPYVVRTGTTLRTGWLVSFYIAAHNPVPVLAVLSALALSIWAAAYLSFAVVLLLPGPLALVWATAVAAATERSETALAGRTGQQP
jgi:hypothetical protein